jgi:hypothetical protein
VYRVIVVTIEQTERRDPIVKVCRPLRPSPEHGYWAFTTPTDALGSVESEYPGAQNGRIARSLRSLKVYLCCITHDPRSVPEPSLPGVYAGCERRTASADGPTEAFDVTGPIRASVIRS